MDAELTLERTDTGPVFTHGDLVTERGTRYPLSLSGEDWDALETALNRDGICGNREPSAFGAAPLVCDLPSGHRGWHGADTDAAQPAGYVPSRCSWTVDNSDRVAAVVEAARAWRAWRGDGRTLTDTAAALVAAVDALDGAS